MANLDEIRKNIILKQGVHYFDFAASGLAYEPVEREIADALKTYAMARRPRSRNFRSC